MPSILCQQKCYNTVVIRSLAYTQSTDCRPQGSGSKYVAQTYGANNKRYLIVGVQM